MNKFLINFQRTGAMFPVKHSMFDQFWNPGSTTAQAETKTISEENKASSQGSNQIATGLQNAQDRKEEEPKPLNIWEEKKDKDGNPIKPEEPQTLFSDLTKEQVDEFAKQVNVLTEADEATIRIIAGDDVEKQQALRQLLGGVGQRAISQAVFSSSKAFGTGVSKELNSQDPKISKLVDEQVKQQALIEQFPMARDPLTAPVFRSVMTNVMKAMPDATKKELFEETQRQLDLISKSAGQKVESPNKPSTNPKDETNAWDAFFK